MDNQASIFYEQMEFINQSWIQVQKKSRKSRTTCTEIIYQLWGYFLARLMADSNFLYNFSFLIYSIKMFFFFLQMEHLMYVDIQFHQQNFMTFKSLFSLLIAGSAVISADCWYGTGNDNYINGIRNSVRGNGNYYEGNFNRGVGDMNSAYGNYNTQYGDQNAAMGDYNKQRGFSNGAFGNYNTQDGSYNAANGNRNTQIGNANYADGNNNYMRGNANEAHGNNNNIFGSWNWAG